MTFSHSDWLRECRQVTVLTGHSLGGMLALYAASLHGLDAVTFNGAYVNAVLRGDRRSDAKQQSTVWSFEAVRDGGVAAERDVVTYATRSWFGSDPIVRQVDIQVRAQDVLMHTLGHFRLGELANRGGLRWVDEAGGAALQLNSGRIRLPEGTIVCKRGDTEDVIALAQRNGYVHGSFVESLSPMGQTKRGRLNGEGVRLRTGPRLDDPVQMQLPKGLDFEILEPSVNGDAHAGSTRWVRIRFMVLVSGRLQPADAVAATAPNPGRG